MSRFCIFRGLRRWWLLTLALLPLLVVLWWAPGLLNGRELPEFDYALDDQLGVWKEVVTERTLAVRIRIVECSLLPVPRMHARAKLRLRGTELEIDGELDYRLGRGWILDARLPSFVFGDDRPPLASVVGRMVRPLLPSLTFGGELSGELHAANTNADAIVRWTAQAKVSSFHADGKASEVPFAVEDFRCRLQASGIADHHDIRPVRFRIGSAAYDTMTVSNVFATVEVNDSHLLVTEAGADFCGGTVRTYSLFLDLGRNAVGATVVAENLDAGEVLRHFRGFDGKATGSLYGKFKFFLSPSGELRLRDMYLHSIPGEQGSLALAETRPLLNLMAMSGLDADSSANLGKVLSRLDYSALRLRLQKESDDDCAINFRIDGSATQGEVTVPVHLDLTCRGSIEQLLNTGLKFKQKGKLK